jgi:alpha-D-ribose 1-methylphosphonate 5-phosphate C-P lyase
MNQGNTGFQYNFGFLDEQTKKMIRRAILKGIAIPGYNCLRAASKSGGSA